MSVLNDLLTSTSRQLKNLLEMRGMTQGALSRRLGVQRSTVSEMLSRRKADMMISTLVRSAEALDAEVVIDIRPRHPKMPTSPLLPYRDDKDMFRCPDGLYTATGNRGEVVAIAKADVALWGLWMGRGGRFGGQVASHVSRCATCSGVCVIEYV